MESHGPLTPGDGEQERGGRKEEMADARRPQQGTLQSRGLLDKLGQHLGTHASREAR